MQSIGSGSVKSRPFQIPKKQYLKSKEQLSHLKHLSLPTKPDDVLNSIDQDNLEDAKEQIKSTGQLGNLPN